MNKKTERINRLIEILRVRHFVSVKELSSLLGVSEMTIRRDLTILESNHVAENIYGTSVYNPAHIISKQSKEYNFINELQRQNTQKDAIGRFAATLIERDDIIILDTGTTTEQIVPHIPSNLNITALCYNINILMELRRNTGVHMLFSGGNYHPNTQMFECPEGIEFIRGIRAQKVFISAAGIHNTLGITCVNSYEVPTKRAILASSLQHILVADAQKFGTVRPSYFCTLADIDVIVTDSALSNEWREHIIEQGITLHLVD